MASRSWLRTFICSYIKDIVLLHLLAVWGCLITFFKHGQQQGLGRWRKRSCSKGNGGQRERLGATGSDTCWETGRSLDAAHNPSHFRAPLRSSKTGTPQNTDRFGRPCLPSVLLSLPMGCRLGLYSAWHTGTLDCLVRVSLKLITRLQLLH